MLLNNIIMSGMGSGIRGCATQQVLLFDYELKDWVPVLALAFISVIILSDRFDLRMNFEANFKIGSIFSDHLIPGLDRILMSWVAKSLQNFQECHPSETPRQYETHRLCVLGCLSFFPFLISPVSITRRSPQMQAAVSHIYGS